MEKMEVDEDFEMRSAASDHRMCPPTTPRGGRAGMRGAGRGGLASHDYAYSNVSSAASSFRGDGGHPRGVGGGRGRGRGRGRAKLSPGYTANDRLKNRKDSCGFMRTSDPVDEEGAPVVPVASAPPPPPRGERRDVNANNPYKIDRRPAQPRATTEEQIPQQSVTAHQDRQGDVKCICLRPLKRVTCCVCGFYVEGRLVRACECHPQVQYLLDIYCCPSCSSPPRFLKELEFPAGYVPTKENIRTV